VENCQDKIGHRTVNSGRRNGLAKLTEGERRGSSAHVRGWPTWAEVGGHPGVHPTTAMRAVTGRGCDTSYNKRATRPATQRVLLSIDEKIEAASSQFREGPAKLGC
jgi:hypothetical protein